MNKEQQPQPQPQPQPQSGFLIINKPVGPTSFDIVYRLRKITNIKKIGHAGTLDPLASGVLVLAIGRGATKKIDNFVKKDKEYIATLQLGAETSTHDREGEITKKEDKIKNIEKNKVIKILEKFIGKQDQIPPMHSAKKVKGRKLYELARKGIEIKRKPSKINIYELELLDYKWPILKLKVKCSSGTYIRSLARDIGRKLKCFAYLKQLERTRVGDFRIESSVKLEDLNEDNWEEYLFDIV